MTSFPSALCVDRFFGLMNGIVALYFFDIFAIFLLSVETITWLKIFDLIAYSIVWAISGLPPIILIFLFGTPREPPLAAIKQTGFILTIRS